MSKPTTGSRRKRSAGSKASGRPTQVSPKATRVDAPHEVCNPPRPKQPAEEAPTSESAPSDSVAEQLRVQATQLASHLRAKQKELDHREAQVHARVAQLERDARTARLWLREREAECNGRDEELSRKEEEVRQRLSRLATTEAAGRQVETKTGPEAALQHQRQQCEAQREASQRVIRRMLANLEQRRKAVEARAAEVQQTEAKPGADLPAREEALQRTAENLEARARQCEEDEARLAEAQAESQEFRRQLTDARRQSDQESRGQRERLAGEQQRSRADLEKQRQAVQRRSDHVDQCRDALEQLRAELGRMHRETLEIRLATEELWVQLSGSAPPAALTRSLGRIRTQLAEHYRTANAELHQKKDELEQIRGQLADQLEGLLKRKREFDQWVATRQEEIQQQAARLVAREQQLDEKQAEQSDQVHGWQAQRLDYQQQIRRLQAELSQQEEASLLPA